MEIAAVNQPLTSLLALIALAIGVATFAAGLYPTDYPTLPDPDDAPADPSVQREA